MRKRDEPARWAIPCLALARHVLSYRCPCGRAARVDLPSGANWTHTCPACGGVVRMTTEREERSHAQA